MLHLLLLILPICVFSGRVSQLHGVAPELRSRYTPSSSTPPTWKCLDDDPHTILWTAVNDDYCDCPDGSDEPGTSACPDTTFYCVNEGHIGARIPSSRVNDGLCEQECCDGSDEPLGVCPNRCREIGEAYKQRMEAERKLRKTGSKIRSTYIAFAHKEKKRLEDSIALLEKEVSTRETDVERLKDIMERTETVSEAALEFKKQSPLYQSLLTHHNALKSLRRAYLKHVEREKQLGDILEALKGGYNPNYQDMAVLEAVKGWEALSETAKDGEELADTTDQSSREEGEWTEGQLEHQLDDVVNQDHVALLLGHESHLSEEYTSLLFDITSYIPEAFAPQYTWFRGTVVGWLRTLGVLRGAVGNAEETSQARTAYNDAESKLHSAKERKRDDQEELAELFDPEGFGLEGEWKKLQGLCLSKETGEYTYEVCLFGDATQKGGAHHNLGKFSSWSTDPNVKPGEPRYYQTQHYTRGAKCWNGPERSVTLHFSCGTENKILTIAEPEKCEYHLTATTPALCLPLEVTQGTREELGPKRPFEVPPKSRVVNMVSLLRTLRSIRRVGLREWFRQMQYIGDAKSGQYVGHDQFGNRYFENLNPLEEIPGRHRWVDYAQHEYNGSQVPPEWHAWITHIRKDPPPEDRVMQALTPSWKAPWRENLTGTRGAYKSFDTVAPRLYSWEPKTTLRK